MAVQEKLILTTEVKGATGSASKLSAVDTQLNKISVSTKKLLGAVGIIALSGAFFSFGKASLTAAAQFEQSQVAFTTMLGSAELAKSLLNELAQFAKKTPFTLTGIETSAQQLLAYGVNLNDILPLLKDLGDISSTVGLDKLPRLIMAMGQVKAKTKLSGEELRQFTETGISLIPELAKVTGFTEKEIASDTKRLGISYSQVREAIKNMTKEGGIAFNAMEAQSKTFSGKMSNLGDSIDLLLRDMGGNFLEFGKDVVDGLIFITENKLPVFLKIFSDSFLEIAEIIETFGSELGSVWSEIMGIFNYETKDKLDNNVDEWTNFSSNVIGVVKTVGASIRQMSIILGGASRALVNILSFNYAEAKNNIEDSTKKVKDINNELKNDLADLGADVIISGKKIQSQSYLTEESFKRLNEIKFNNLVSGFDDVSNGSKKSSKALKEQENALVKLTQEYRNSKDIIKKELESLNEAHTKNLSDINEKIKNTKNELIELEKDFSETQSGESKGFAQEYIAQQEKIKKIEEDIFNEKQNWTKEKGINERNEIQARINALTDSLSKEKEALENAAFFIESLKINERDFSIQIENEISEQKERARKTEFQNFLNDFKAKRIEEKNKLESDRILLNEKLESFKSELRMEDISHKLAQGRIESRMNMLTSHYMQVMKNNTEITKNELNTQITFFNRLEDAARSALRASQAISSSSASFGGARAYGGLVSSGSSYLVGERGPELFTPNISGNITPNNKLGAGPTINISGIFGSDAAEELGNMIVSRLSSYVAI